MIPNPWLLAGLLGAFLVSNAITATVSYEKGKHKAELTCAKADSEALAAGIDKWQKAAAEQRTKDAAARLQDAAASAKATDAAMAVASRFEALKIAVVKMPPKGACDLSQDWVGKFNEAK